MVEDTDADLYADLYGLATAVSMDGSAVFDMLAEDESKKFEEAKLRPVSVTQCYYCGAREKYGSGTRNPTLRTKHLLNCPER